MNDDTYILDENWEKARQEEKEKVIKIILEIMEAKSLDELNKIKEKIINAIENEK